MACNAVLGMHEADMDCNSALKSEKACTPFKACGMLHVQGDIS